MVLRGLARDLFQVAQAEQFEFIDLCCKGPAGILMKLIASFHLILAERY